MLAETESKLIWKYFKEICNIPHCSKFEEKLADYIVELAKTFDIEVFKDENGNVIARKEANGYPNAPTITLQAHLDMVCEKNKDTTHDFSIDPIQTQIDGEWLTAKGTTLGADNGIGVATCLALMESKDIKHGPLEFLLTIDEETGLTGAFKLKKENIKGNLLINLDSEDWGVIFIGCAGGGDTKITYPLEYDNVENKQGYKITLKGLRGGHSGIEIDKGRGNAIKLLSRLLYAINASISKIEGGDKHNAIPREAIAEIITDEEIESKVREFEKLFKNEYIKTDPDIKIIVEPTTISKVLSKKNNEIFLRLLMGLPHGILAMSQDVEGLVETSTNFATLHMKETALIGLSSRSSIKSSLDNIRQIIESIALLSGAKVEHGEAYPGWKPNLDSRLLSLASKAYEEMFNDKIKKEAIHAGLEAGILGEITGISEIISIGPEIQHPHSPDERVNIPSTDKFWKYLLYILEKVAIEW